MQKIATRVFIYASIVFGLAGLTMVLTDSGPDKQVYGLELVLVKIFTASIFVILSSFALSVAGKYLKAK